MARAYELDVAKIQIQEKLGVQKELQLREDRLFFLNNF